MCVKIVVDVYEEGFSMRPWYGRHEDVITPEIEPSLTSTEVARFRMGTLDRGEAEAIKPRYLRATHPERVRRLNETLSAPLQHEKTEH